MKHLILAFVFLCAVGSLSAQKVTYKDGTIFKDAQPYGYIKKQGNVLSGQAFSIRALNDKEVIFVKDIAETDYYEVIFRESGQKAYIQADLNTAKMLAKLMVQKNMLTPEGLNPEGERYFLQEYGTAPAGLQGQLNAQSGVYNQPTVGGNTPGLQYETVERNRNEPLYFLYEEIRQGIDDIAQYTIDREVEMGGMQVKIIFKLPNGLKVAQATYTESQSSTISLLTLRDNQVHTFPYSGGMLDQKVVEILGKFLVQRNYL
jgi:hypothetical protein